MEGYKIIGIIITLVLIIVTAAFVVHAAQNVPDAKIPAERAIFNYAAAHNITVLRAESIENRFITGGLGGGNQVMIDVKMPDASSFLQKASKFADEFDYVDTYGTSNGKEAAIRHWAAFSSSRPMSSFVYFNEGYEVPAWHYVPAPEKSTASMIVFEPTPWGNIIFGCLLAAVWLIWIAQWQSLCRLVIKKPKTAY